MMSRIKYKQISLEEALERYKSGLDTNVMMPAGDEWEDYYADTLMGVFEGIMCFVDADAEQDTLDQTLPPPPEAVKKVPVKSTRKKKIDMGKLMALHNAGWSNLKIAGELKISDVTVGKYIKQSLAERETGEEHDEDR